MNNYSAWKLFKSQWSWKRDLRTALVLHPLGAMVITTGMFILVDVSGDNIYIIWLSLFFAYYSLMLFVYFSIKLFCMTLFSLMMSRAAKEDDDFKQKYNEALTWRK